MDYALVENGCVVNLLWLHPANAAAFPGAVPCGGAAVQAGDVYDGQSFFRDGQKVLSRREEMLEQIAELDAAVLELQYQQLIGGFEE